MNYIALLRGINVGGNSLIKMSELKSAFEACGYSKVRTFINSGNIIFEAKGKDSSAIRSHLEHQLSKTFAITLSIAVIDERTYEDVVKSAPKGWKTRTDIRRYVAFMIPPATPKDVVKEVKLTKDVDSIDLGNGVVYMTTIKDRLTKSGFTRLIGKKIYKSMTWRNFTTCQKVVNLLKEE